MTFEFRFIVVLSIVFSVAFSADGQLALEPQAPFPGAPKVLPLSLAKRLELAEQARGALSKTLGLKVLYQDLLGEGPDAWDPDPRYPGQEVNCITWLQLFLAEFYGRDLGEKQQVLDRVRYFGGHIGFGFRKHFTDQWTELDPLPLSRIDLSSCPDSATTSLRIDLEPTRFQKSAQFDCPLLHMEKTSVELPVTPAHGLVQCGRLLPPGYFILFPVASERYLKKYGGFSGPMGQVHALVVEVPPFPAPGAPPRDAAQYRVYHASISSGKVMETELGSFVLSMWNLYRGYVLYELVPDWDWSRAEPLTPEGQLVAACEAKLEGTVGKLFEHEVQAAPSQVPRQR